MRRTGSIFLIGVLLSVLFPAYAFSAKRDVMISVNAEKRKVDVGEEFSITYSVSVEDGNKFRVHRLPEFPGFAIVSESERTGAKMISGSAYTVFTFNYKLKATESGILKTGRASFIYGRVTYTTAPVEINALKPKALPKVKKIVKKKRKPKRVKEAVKKEEKKKEKVVTKLPEKPKAKPKKQAVKKTEKKVVKEREVELKASSEALMKSDDTRFNAVKEEKKQEKAAMKAHKMKETAPSDLKVASEALIKRDKRYEVVDTITYDEKKKKEVGKKSSPPGDGEELKAASEALIKRDTRYKRKTDDIKKTEAVKKKPVKETKRAEKKKPDKEKPDVRSVGRAHRGKERKAKIKFPDEPVRLFVLATVNRYNPFVGEGIVYTFKLYHRADYYGSPVYTPPQFAGFFVGELPQSRSVETIKGLSTEYIIEELNYALYPLLSGDVRIPEAVLEYKDGTKEIKVARSNTVDIEVAKLPEYDGELGAPYTGSVGVFKVSQKIEDAELYQYEPFTLTVQVRGRGNIQSISEPHFSDDRNFTYTLIDTSENIITEIDGISGGKEFTYSVVPKKAGKLAVGGVSYVYFDINKLSYTSTSTKREYITVIKSDGANEPAMINSEVLSLLAPIRFGDDVGIKREKPFYMGRLFFYLMAALFLSSVMVVTYSYQKVYRVKNKHTIKRRKAIINALSSIEYARSHLNNRKIEEFYAHVYSLLSRFYIDRYDIDLITHPLDSIDDMIRGNGNEKELIKELTAKVRLLNYFRFSSKSKVTEEELKIFLVELNNNIREIQRCGVH